MAHNHSATSPPKPGDRNPYFPRLALVEFVGGPSDGDMEWIDPIEEPMVKREGWAYKLDADCHTMRVLWRDAAS